MGSKRQRPASPASYRATQRRLRFLLPPWLQLARRLSNWKISKWERFLVTDDWQRYLQAPRIKPTGPIKDAADQKDRREQKEGKTTKDDQGGPSTDFAAL